MARMTREKLKERLAEIIEANYDGERSHVKADEALLAFINDPEVSELHANCAAWYA